MTLVRGQVVTTRFPHATGTRGKKRPVLIVQDDGYNQRDPHFLVAEITTNLAVANDPSSLFVDVSTTDGRATGLDENSVVSCLFLATIWETRIGPPTGQFSAAMMLQIDACLKAALGLP